MSRKADPTRVPPFVLHKSSGQGFARINGRDFYFGRFDDPLSRRKYERQIGEWLANDRVLEVGESPDTVAGLTVAEFCLRFLEWAETYFQKGGRKTSEIAIFKLVISKLVRKYGALPVYDVTPLRLKALREQFITEEYARTTINAFCGKIARMWKWGVENELVLRPN